MADNTCRSLKVRKLTNKNHGNAMRKGKNAICHKLEVYHRHVKHLLSRRQVARRPSSAPLPDCRQSGAFDRRGTLRRVALADQRHRQQRFAHFDSPLALSAMGYCCWSEERGRSHLCSKRVLGHQSRECDQRHSLAQVHSTPSRRSPYRRRLRCHCRKATMLRWRCSSGLARCRCHQSRGCDRTRWY